MERCLDEKGKANSHLIETCFIVVHVRYEGQYRNLVIIHVENISYVNISCSFNFVRSPYRMKHV